MADHDQFEDGVNDGDTISDGWYNGCYTEAQLIAMRGILDEGIGKNKVEETFTSDTASTKTNFTYDEGENAYYCKGNQTGTLITQTQWVDTYADVQRYGYLRWDYKVYEVYDEIDDSSWDTNLWDSNTTPTETNEYFHWTGAYYVGTDATNGDFYGTDDIVVIEVRVTAYDDVYGGSIEVWDGTNYVQVSGAIRNSNGIQTFTLKFDSTNDQVFVWKNGHKEGVYDLSSLTNNKWMIRINSDGTRNAHWYWYWCRKYKATPSTTVTEYLSSDDGTNFTTADSNGFVDITSSSERGIRMKAKLVANVASNEVIVVRRCDYMMWDENKK